MSRIQAGWRVRFVRSPQHDKRVPRGDNFAGDAWIDQETGQIVYGVVGHDRNAPENREAGAVTQA